MDLRCPKCNSTDLKKVSLAYEEGLFRTEGRTRLRAAVVGAGGPDLVVGRATTRGTHQTSLSKRLSPPKRWSYLKLFVGFAVATFIAFIFYIHNVMANSFVSSSLPVKLYSWIASFLLVLLLLLTWRHNHSTFPREYAEWDDSFVCMRCGANIKTRAEDSISLS